MNTFDPNDPRFNRPSPGPKLDPATLPTGLDPPSRASLDLLATLTRQGLIVDGPPPRAQRPPIIPDAFILYPFLLAVFPAWSYGLQAIGDCMAWASADAIDNRAALQIEHLTRPERPIGLAMKEALYGFMRVEVYGYNQNTSGDGADPAAAAAAVVKFGSLHYINYLADKYQFPNYDKTGARARSYGRYGVPNDLEPTAAEHPVIKTERVTSFERACELLAQGCPIANAHPANPIYRSRDKDAFGTNPWRASHAMNYSGYRLGARPGLLKTNTGHGYHVDGTRWPADMPDVVAHCSAWEDATTSDAILQYGWSYAHLDYKGAGKTVALTFPMPRELYCPKLPDHKAA